MAMVPVAADYCWACSRYYGEVDGECDSEYFDCDDAEDRFQVCGICRAARFCSAKCCKTGHDNDLCAMNVQLIGKSLRQQLHHGRVKWGAQPSRHISMLQAMHYCWGLELKVVSMPDCWPEEVQQAWLRQQHWMLPC